MNKKLLIIIIAVFISLGAVAVASGYYLAYKNKTPQVAGESEKILTASWKEYVNSKYGYKIKYPIGWNIDGTSMSPDIKISKRQEGDEGKILQSSGKIVEGISISARENPKSLSSSDWVLANISAQNYQKRNLSSEQYNNISATKIIDYLDTSYAVFFAREALIYEVRVFEKDKKILNALLNTFSYIKPTTKEYKVYKVKEGETLSYIASKFNIAWPKLAVYNKLKSPDGIYAGQKLKIPLDPNSVPSSKNNTSIDLDLARRYQNTVDSGREVWRLQPLDVAKKEIPPQKDICENDQFRITNEDKLAGEVTIEITTKDGLQYIAKMVQPIRKGAGGIWMVELLTLK